MGRCSPMLGYTVWGTQSRGRRFSFTPLARHLCGVQYQQCTAPYRSEPKEKYKTSTWCTVIRHSTFQQLLVAPPPRAMAVRAPSGLSCSPASSFSAALSLCLAHSSCSDWVATSHFTGLIVNQASPLAFPGLLDWRQGPLLDCCHRHLSIQLSLIICTRAAGAVIICLPVYMCVLYLACGTIPAMCRHSGSSYSLHD